MPRILLIALSNTYFGQIKDKLTKNSFTVTLLTEESEIFELISSTSYDCYILEPFSNFKMAAKIIRILNEKKCLHKILLLLPGLRPHEELTAKKIVQENYFSTTDSLEYIINKINFICSTNSTLPPNKIKIRSPAFHHTKSENQISEPTTPKLSDMLMQLEPFDKLFRRSRNENVANAIEINTYIPVNFLPPTWLGAFYQIENNPAQFYQCFIENDPKIAGRILTFGNRLILCFSQYVKNTNFKTAKTFQEITSIIGIDEFKNICIFSVLENVFTLELDQYPALKNQVYLQIAVALELSKWLDYQKKTELLLCLFCQNISYILIKKKSPNLYQSTYDKNQTTNTSIAKLFFENLNFTPSELTRLFLKRWNIEEHIAESAFCARYEFLPKLNPQLTAITHLAIVTANFITKVNQEQNLKLSKIAMDEIRLRSRSFKFDSINYLNDKDNPWREFFLN